MKQLLISSVINALIAAVVSGGMAIGVVHYIQYAPPPVKSTAAKPDTTNNNLDDQQSIFVSLPETIVTLYGENNDEHYMLIELAMVIDDKNMAQKIHSQEALYQSLVLNALSAMNYNQIRQLKIADVRQIILQAISKGLKEHEMSIPYKDILIRKMILQ